MMSGFAALDGNFAVEIVDEDGTAVAALTDANGDCTLGPFRNIDRIELRRRKSR